MKAWRVSVVVTRSVLAETDAEAFEKAREQLGGATMEEIVKAGCAGLWHVREAEPPVDGDREFDGVFEWPADGPVADVGPSPEEVLDAFEPPADASW